MPKCTFGTEGRDDKSELNEDGDLVPAFHVNKVSFFVLVSVLLPSCLLH